MAAVDRTSAEVARLRDTPWSKNGSAVVTKSQCDFIRSLEDFDLTMLISEIHEHGWKQARELLPLIKEAIEVRALRERRIK